MKKSTRTAPTRPIGRSRPSGDLRQGLVVLVGAVLVLAAISGLRFERPMKVFVAGEIASQDVTADQDLLVEDMESTQSKREQVAQNQPPLFDLSSEPAHRLQKRISDLFATLETSQNQPDEALLAELEEQFGTDVRSFTLSLWRSPEFQQLMLGPVLEWLQSHLDGGVLAERRIVQPFKQGIIIRDLATGQEQMLAAAQDLPDIPELLRELDMLLVRQMGEPLRVRKAVNQLVEPLITPSLTYNQEATQNRIREVTAAVEPVYYQIKKGEIIVRQGARVGPDQQLKMQALYSRQRQYFNPFQAGGVFVIGLMLVLALYLARWNQRQQVFSDRDAVLLASVLVLFGLGAKVLAFLDKPLAEGIVFLDVSPELFAYLLPVAGAGGALAMFFGTGVCFFSTLILSFTCAVMLDAGLPGFLYYFVGGMFAVFFYKRAQSRNEMLATVLPLIGALCLAWAGVSLLDYRGVAHLGEGMAAAAINGAFSLVAVLALSPMVELAFGYSSRFKLMELMNLEQPLLQELMVNAPGTYHHSLVVSNMVEAGARAIGANALLAKVSALYHDIGKLRNPHYFIENQFGQLNKHDKLTPSMSALVLISHVKKGLELAREHRLGPEITDIIQQHHGTSLISYFYTKAQEQAEQKGGEAVREEDYRYPGPKPQTKEAGLIMLADAIEASSRTLGDPTPSRIKGHIDKLIRTIFSEGQLDESELTLKDLHLVAQAFQRILTGIFHQRIEYPAKADETRFGAPRPNRAPEPEPARTPVSPPTVQGNGNAPNSPPQPEHPLPMPSSPAHATPPTGLHGEPVIQPAKGEGGKGLKVVK